MSVHVRCGFAGLGALALAGCAPTPQQRAAKDMSVLQAEAAPERLLARGEASTAAGDLTRAEQYFVAALHAGGDERLLTRRLLVVCVTDGRFPAAANYGEDYLRRHPGDTEIRYAVATVHVALGEVEEARLELERVIRERPELAEAHYALATVLRQQGEAALDVERQFREYIRLEPNGPYAEPARASLVESSP